jgi:hypothetical protein
VRPIKNLRPIEEERKPANVVITLKGQEPMVEYARNETSRVVCERKQTGEKVRKNGELCKKREVRGTVLIRTIPR